MSKPVESSAPLTGVEEHLLSGVDLTIAEVNSLARGKRKIGVTRNPLVIERMQQAEALVHKAVTEGWRVYGVTTGFGSMSDVPIPAELASASQSNLLAFLSTGAGRQMDACHVRAAMLLRANMLLKGVSGARLEVVERLVAFLNADAVPVVRELGSIGASGDLVPLATIARAITGQGTSQVALRGKVVSSQDALAELGFPVLEMIPKEGLAIVNGTSFSAAIAANCVHASSQLMSLAFASHAMMLRGLCGHEDPFLPFVHECKPHPGQVWSAAMMRQLLDQKPQAKNGKKSHDQNHLQDSYSLRCLPQYMGPIVEGMARVSETVEREMNSVTDNPLVNTEQGRFYQSGNFLGQYIGIAMDDLRRFLGLLAKHLDVQIARLVAPEFNHGLPASLQGNRELSLNMGLKGLQITGNSIMPMLTYYGNPLVEQFPTHAEHFNQNLNGLSWGSANLAAQSVELFTHYTAVAIIFSVQALDLRAREMYGHYDGRALVGQELIPLYEAVCETFGSSMGEQKPLVFNDADQSLEISLAQLADNIFQEGSIVASVSPVLDAFAQFAQQTH